MVVIIGCFSVGSACCRYARWAVYLSAGIAEPHGMDVARKDEGVFIGNRAKADNSKHG